MKWFKHMTDASDDEFIADIEDEFGLEGYARWWKLLEVVASQMGVDGKCSAAFPVKKWCRKLRCKPNLLGRFLKRTENLGKTKVTENGNIMEIKIPKLLELRDNHTKNLQATCKQLASKEVEVEVEVEVDKEPKKNISKKRISNPKPKNPPEKKIHYAEFVTMTETEHGKLIALHGSNKTSDYIEKLNEYKGSSGRKYKSDYHTILTFIRKDKEREPKTPHYHSHADLSGERTPEEYERMREESRRLFAESRDFINKLGAVNHGK